MAPQDLEHMKNTENNETLLNLIMSSQEMEPVKRELTRNFEEVKKLAGKSK
jgi:hypothetical protein